MTIFIFILQQMMVFSIPLLVVALAAMYSERSGVINIGLEGIMVMGAFAGTLYLHFANLSENFQSGSSLLIAILLSVVVGILYSALHAFA